MRKELTTEQKQLKKEYDKQYRIANKERDLIYREQNKKHVSEYQKSRRNKISATTKQWRINNPEKWELQKEKHKSYLKQYYQDNKEKIKQCTNENIKNRMNIDEAFKLKRSLSTLIRNSFNCKDLKKCDKTINILGCSIEYFKEYLESKFENWMCWQNKGLYNGTLNYGWDIDHIIPLSSVNTLDEIINLCHYTNLQPLCSYTNRYIKKGNV